MSDPNFRLKDFQVPHVEAIVKLFDRHDIVIDKSTMGAGKTITSLAVAKTLGLKPFVICTKSVIEYWQEWADIVGVELAGVRNYESLIASTMVTDKETKTEYRKRILKDLRKAKTVEERNKLKDALSVYEPKTKRRYLNLQSHPNASDLVGGWEFVNRNWVWNLDPNTTLLVMDEAHKLGGKKSKVSFFLKAAADQEFRSLLLSATLIDHPMRMRALAYALKLFRGWSSAKFDAWCMLHGCDLGDSGRLEFCGDQEYIEEIKEAIGERLIGIDTADIPGFPKSNIILLSVPYKGPNLDDAYAKELKELEIESETEGVAALRSRQLSEWGKREWVVDRARENEAEGFSVVIFTSFVPTGEWISEKLKCPFVSGGTKKTRKQSIDKFQNNETPFIVVMVDAGGESISLHDLHGRPRVVYLSPNHNGTLFKQALGRTPRTNSKQAVVNQYIMFARGSTVEGRVRNNLRKKVATINTINSNDLEALPSKMIKAEEIPGHDNNSDKESDMPTHQCSNCRIATSLGTAVDGRACRS